MALKRVCDITGSDLEVEVCDVTIAGQVIKLDLSPVGAEKLLEFFGPVASVQHPGAVTPDDEAAPEPLDEPQSEAVEAAPAPAARRAAKKTGRKPAGAKSTARATAKPGKTAESDGAAIREWARAEGMEVSDRGAIPGKVRSAYALAHE